MNVFGDELARMMAECQRVNGVDEIQFVDDQEGEYSLAVHMQHCFFCQECVKEARAEIARLKKENHS